MSDTNGTAQNRRAVAGYFWALVPLLPVVVWIAQGGWWVYDNFLRKDPPPISTGADAVGDDKLIDIYADAKVSRRSFNTTYWHKAFSAEATFIHGAPDHFRYDIDVFVGAYIATCRTGDPDTVALVQKLATNAHVRITGLIEDMNERTLTLSRCALHR
jgi:hypothetical protein